jgi:Ulp1 protease family, C-terminal catalytic domain
MELLRLPPNIQKHLPPTNLSVHQFLAVTLPPCATVTTRLWRTQKYYSNLLPTSDNVDEITSLLQVSPPDDILVNLQQLVQTQSDVKSIQCPHSMTAGRQRYPLWLVSFWVQLSSVRKTQLNWETAVQNLETQMARNQDDLLLQETFNSLAYVPWTGYLQGLHSTIQSHQLSVYFTRDWLTDDHLLVMLDTLKADLVMTGQDNYFIENTAFMTLLSGAYHNKDEYQTEHLYGWMRKRGEDLASGRKRYLATVANQDNVHWVALVVDFVTQELLYGDSFGHPISASMLAVINW